MPRSVRSVATPVAALVGVVLVAAGCGSSGGAAPSTGPTPTSAPSTSALPSGRAVAVAPLANRVVRALQQITSAHLTIDGGVLLGDVSGNALFDHGAAKASDLTVRQGSSNTRVITVGSTSYAETGSGGKPWTKLSGSNSAGLAQTLSVVNTLGSLNNLAGLVSLASSAVDRGATGSGHEYAVVLDPAKAKGTAFASIMQLAGSAPIPVVIDLDSHDRPTHVKVSFSVAGQSFSVTADISGYNVPVQIAAPPSTEVSNP